MKVRIEVDYPDRYVELYGAQDAADTFAAKLNELYPGDQGDVWVPERVSVVLNADVPGAARVYDYGHPAGDVRPVTETGR